VISRIRRWTVQALSSQAIATIMGDVFALRAELERVRYCVRAC